jgi:hypothetical protein
LKHFYFVESVSAEIVKTEMIIAAAFKEDNKPFHIILNSNNHGGSLLE